MNLLDEFKIYCRDKGKYNVTDLNEIMKLYEEFEEDRKSKKNYSEIEQSSTNTENLSKEDSEGYFAQLFSSLNKQ